MKHLALLLPACLALAACAPSNNQGQQNGAMQNGSMQNQGNMGNVMPNQNMAQGGRFSCQNGLYVNINRLNMDQIELRLDDKYAVLQSAVSGSGERYVSNQGLFGSGAEWHQKGSDAIFNFTDPYGNRVETVCQATN